MPSPCADDSGGSTEADDADVAATNLIMNLTASQPLESRRLLLAVGATLPPCKNKACTMSNFLCALDTSYEETAEDEVQRTCFSTDA